MSTLKKPQDYWLLNWYDLMLMESKSKFIYHVKKKALVLCSSTMRTLSYLTQWHSFSPLTTEDVTKCWKKFPSNIKMLLDSREMTLNLLDDNEFHVPFSSRIKKFVVKPMIFLILTPVIMSIKIIFCLVGTENLKKN